MAVIDHVDLDRLAAEGRIRAGVGAVVNASRSISVRYPNMGPLLLAAAGIPLVDDVGPAVMTAVAEGQAVSVLDDLGLRYAVFGAAGTSEDIAMLLAYEKRAALIVAVGAHASMVEFLDKGRAGMASTFLVRLKVGSILVDAKGVRACPSEGRPGSRNAAKRPWPSRHVGRPQEA